MAKQTQEERILNTLKQNEWVNGRYFFQTMMISQFHARIWSLQKKGYRITASKESDEYGFKSYRLLASPLDGSLAPAGELAKSDLNYSRAVSREPERKLKQDRMEL